MSDSERPVVGETQGAPMTEWESIPAMTKDAAVRFGDRLAVRDGHTELTYEQLFDRSRSFAGGLVDRGVEPGDRVAVWAFNSAEWIIAVLGLFQAGCVLVPVNTRFKGVEASGILRRSSARVLVTVTDFLDTDYLSILASAGIELPELETIIVASGRVPSGAISWSSFVSDVPASAIEKVGRRSAAINADDMSDILFTSGTTGVAKGVVMTQSRTLGIATDWVRMTGLSVNDRYLMINPYFHMFGLKAGILACVASGAAMFPQAVFNVESVLARVAEEQITVLPGPPTLYQAILDHPRRDGFDLSSLRVAVTGAADIPVQLVRRIDEELPFSRVITAYGLTEAGTASATVPDDDAEAVATTVGKPRPGFEIRVVGPDSRQVACSEAGEVLLKGPTVMLGYLDDPEATAAALSPQGWLQTGDLGVMDENGRLRIVGRAKEMFIVGGFNAYPAEIENALLRHPGISQAAVIGIPDARLGEVGMAFVVTTSKAQLQPDEILTWCRDQMANYKVPRALQILDELPVNATGKVVKEALRTRVADQGRIQPL
ncbi:MAG: FadD3 family acyl-CoA ligase [Acidimicrobiales bacterium]